MPLLINPTPPQLDYPALIVLAGVAFVIACVLGGCSDQTTTTRACGHDTLHGKRTVPKSLSSSMAVASAMPSG